MCALRQYPIIHWVVSMQIFDLFKTLLFSEVKYPSFAAFVQNFRVQGLDASRA